MALTVTNVLPLPYRVVGNQKETAYDVTFDESYAEGGEPITNAELGLSIIERTQCDVRNGSESETNPVDNGYHKELKLHLIDGKTSKEMAKEKDMSKVVLRVISRGW